MGCCLAIALVLAIARRLTGRRAVDAGFAPTARRHATSSMPADTANTVEPRADQPPSQPRRRRAILLGIAAGLGLHAAVLSALIAAGVAEPAAISAWLRTGTLGLCVLLLAACAGAQRAAPPADRAGVALAASGTLLLAELVDLHLLDGLAFVGPAAPTVDLLFHALPLAAALCGVALSVRPLARQPRLRAAP